MVIQIRGTSGSGKTWAMKEVIKKLDASYNREPVFVEGRKKPLYYFYPQLKLAVLGHYESACGGCDTIGSARQIYELLLKIDEERGNECERFLTEGLLWSEDFKWTADLSEITEVHAFFLITEIEQCVRQVKSRRKEQGNSKPLNEDNTRNRVARIESARLRLVEHGETIVVRVSARQAVKKIIKLLGERLPWTKNKLG